ncbi:NPCBM/NEW2 domain-containing protein [Oerskovia flava]|uniref:NPCBM/NEW2 domain-containing protein n=1 Tax=Oerskovia flava TaxID=2986422 RepID=UPI002240984E|nr:NPCBM/NEW2 domain-containing protein [Oerskovia sp. JB1-3-2]
MFGRPHGGTTPPPRSTPDKRTAAPTALSMLVVAAVAATLAVPAPALADPGQKDDLVHNGGFELGAEGWEFVGGGLATNNPRSGTGHAYLNAGASNEITQELDVVRPGDYLAEAWIATSRAGGTFGVRDDEGTVLATVPIPQQTAYRSYTLPPVALDPDAGAEVFVTGSTGWVNVDDVSVTPELRTLYGFELDGQQGPALLDQNERTVAVQLPYETDVTGLTGAATIPTHATISPDPAGPRDYSAPVEFTVTDAAGSTTVWTVTVTHEAKTVTIDSDNKTLVDAFNWSKWRAREHVQTGKTGPINVSDGGPGTTQVDYIPSYWAGYAHRTAFYSRDFVHQAAGGHLLGLEEENKSMLRAFAASANEARKWYPLWALNFDGSPYSVDYRSDTNFVREVPAVFELVHEAHDQYLWTGDTDYLDDEVLWQYYTKAVTDFVELHDTQIPNGVAEGTGRGIFAGAASYNERGDHAVIEAGDGIASQYRGFLAYAELARAKGDDALAAEFTTKADELRDYFNTDWGVTRGAWEYVKGRTPEGDPVTGFGREASVFIGLKEIGDPDSKRTVDFIDWLDEMYVEDRPPNIEATTYVPDTLFTYGRDEQAWVWMKDIISKLHLPHEVRTQGSNGDYPETSYTLVSQTIEGLAGVRPNAPEHAVTVRSHLPSEIGHLDLDHITVGEHDLGVRHDGRTRTTVTHGAGPQPLTTTVQFAGGWPKISVNGKPQKVEHVHVAGRAVTQVTVNVPVGATVTFETVGDDDPNRFGDTILTHPTDFELLSPADGATGVSTHRTRLTWTRSDNAKSYVVQVARDAGMTDLVAEEEVRGPVAHIDGLAAGRTYYWEVTAINPTTGQRLTVPGGERRFRTEPAAVPDAPTGVAAYRSDDLVGVVWSAAESAVTSTVYRAAAGTDDFEVLATDLTGTTFLDRSAGGGTYRYRVTSTNELGEGPGTAVEEQDAPADGPTEHLSDREWISATSGWRTVNKDRAVSGNPLRIDGTTYTKGIGTHANSRIEFELEPGDAIFRAVVGIDDAQRTSPNTSIGFQVFADDELVFDSGVMRASPTYSPPQEVQVPVLGVQRLVLVVHDAGDGNNSDHANWADARVVTLPTG